MSQLPWWKQCVVYQIYPRSFLDSNGDGIGDLRGITSKVDYLKALGIEVVWLSPIYRSPNDDNGYDISDYRSIMDEFGTMADFDALLAALHDQGIRLVMDLVVNHTSDEHHWFQQARQSRTNPYRDYYIWRPPVEGREPNNWESAFGGSAWTSDAGTGEYYLHMFSRKQPDLNWENPKVREEVFDLMHFWLKKGVDGFRMDVINMISKPADLPDAPCVRAGFLQPAFGLVTNGPRLMAFLSEMKREVLSHYNCMTVGEAPLATTRQGQQLTDETQGALNMLFQFEQMDLDCVAGQGKWALRNLDLREFKTTMTRWQNDLRDRGWNSLYLSNHDQPRPVSRFGNDGAYRVTSAKMLATCLHFMQGTPFIYQGEELGMTNARFDDIGDYRDIETLNFYRESLTAGKSRAETMTSLRAKSRDNARTPMQWDERQHAGFTTGSPWLKVNPNYKSVNARQALNDEDSVWHYYRRLIALRKRLPVMTVGRYDLLMPDDPHVYAYTRSQDGECLLVLCNFSDGERPVALPDTIDLGKATLVIANLEVQDAPVNTSSLKPYEARVYRFSASGQT